jgi:hypothetical protein
MYQFYRHPASLLTALGAIFFSQPSYALNESFNLYSPLQALCMGNAFTADANGYVANYYNPAGLTKSSKRDLEVNFIGIDTNFNFGALGKVLSAQSLGFYQNAAALQSSPGTYSFFQMSGIPSISRKGFSFSLLSNYRFAGQSDGTTLDTNSLFDLGTTVGYAMTVYRDLLTVGVTGKALVRNQFKGSFAHSSVSSEAAVRSLSSEGVGVGGDVGLSFVLPDRYLPTWSLVWKDVLNTRFSSTHFLNSSASGTPDSITQSVNFGFSIHPYLGKRYQATFAVEMQHLLENDLGFRKRLHIGVQLASEKSSYIWAGLNQLYWTFGFGLRLKGGNLEIGTYAEDIGTVDTPVQDRRILMRYTIGL